MRRASGSLFGLAYGDALGRETEFLPVARIEELYGPGGPRELTGEPALVTDDTQMALTVAWALRDARGRRNTGKLTAATLERPLRERFVDWSVSPDNDRAPGRTCMTACEGLAAGKPWVEASVHDSKGCGANMRVTPVGLIGDIDLDTMAGAAQFQAALTHGHPTALVAAELTAYTTRLLREGHSLVQTAQALHDRCLSQRRIYREEWLGDLWKQAGARTPEEFIGRGWSECRHAVDTLWAAYAFADRTADPCLATGAGWVAEEALATGLLCAMMFPDDPVAALGRAANSSGDSDSIACLTGAFLGAMYGMDVWPEGWDSRIEYADQLAELGAVWD